MIRLVDDQELSRHLRQGTTSTARAQVFTTGCWYVRLCQAVIAARCGVWSTPFASLSLPRREQALRSILALPDDVGLVSFRDLGPLIGQLRLKHKLNLLSAEALAAEDCSVQRLYDE
jgi:hypothetical protein